MSARVTGVLVAATLLLFGVAAAGEPDWFTRVKEMGLDKACAVEVSRHEAGVLSDSLHVGRCYYDLGRYEEGLGTNRKREPIIAFGQAENAPAVLAMRTKQHQVLSAAFRNARVVNGSDGIGHVLCREDRVSFVSRDD